ncbi:CAP domain-containing protein [Sporomusa aerivorans]|uniref:CAP domain-containing protein n=1 Tax=Sporomusa aerivorans TaxID=204936 RepID=UPI00352AB6EB
MIQRFFKTKVLSGLLAVTMFSTSFGGVLALPAHAESTDNAVAEESVKDTDTVSTNTILAGIAAIGLIATLSKHRGSSSKGSAKTTTTSGSDNSSNSGSTSTSGSTGTSASGSEESQALSLLNQDRASNGLSALKSNSQLTKLAENYAGDMINRGYFSHYNPEGQSPFDRMTNAGISYKTAGENLAINTSVTAAEKAFMNSSGHRANILNSTYTDVGIGVMHSPSGSVYVVQEFISK